MLRDLLRHIVYILLNIIAIFVIFQLAVTATRIAFDFGRDFIIEQLAEYEEEYVIPEEYEEPDYEG